MNDKHILLVEDNQDDAMLAIRALRRCQISNPIDHVTDGVEALDYLRAQGEYAHRAGQALPQVVLLDLNMPRMGGLETLKHIRENPATALLPVVILTTSREESDMIEAYQNHANSYISKPVDFNDFTEAMRTLGLYWLIINERPPAG